jgi:hypothetical protein
MGECAWPKLYNGEEPNSVERGDEKLFGYSKYIERWKGRSRSRKRKNFYDHPEVQGW